MTAPAVFTTINTIFGENNKCTKRMKNVENCLKVIQAYKEAFDILHQHYAYLNYFFAVLSKFVGIFMRNGSTGEYAFYFGEQQDDRELVNATLLNFQKQDILDVSCHFSVF